MGELARGFVTRETLLRFAEIKAQLEALKTRPAISWQVARDRPLVTRPSEGEWEIKRGGKGAHSVVANIAFLWELAAADEKVRMVHLSGNATTRIELIDVAPDTEASLAMWRMEIGGIDSPGCCFHAQILGEDADYPFPRSLPIPRLPSIPITPMGALEFVLSELFQTEWLAEVGRTTGPSRLWRSVQLARWNSFLSWQRASVDDSTASPWVALKGYPPANMFMSK